MDHDAPNNHADRTQGFSNNEVEAMGVSVTDHQDVWSDYGSDFTPDEEEILKGLLQQGPGELDNPNSDPDLQLKDIEDEATPKGARVRRLGYEDHLPPAITAGKGGITFEVDGNGSTPKNIESITSRTLRERSVSIEAPLDPKPDAPDPRSPLERFRTKPKKTLSVTDIVSPSWCELQYWFVLTKHGKKRRTPAMKQGSAVHKTLEDQVHQTVPVDITSKEDAWGLRIWNIIQGLKTLRETGMTRELEVWGTVDGLVVNGVIDELSYTCPDQDLEESEEKDKHVQRLPANQTTITNFLGGSTLENDGHTVFQDPRSLRDTPKIYLTDVKTRGIKTMPKGASFRPTLLQLMLYHRLLADLATNQVDADVVFDRYTLDPDAHFSDSFIAQIGGLNEAFYDAPSSSSEADGFPSTQDSITVLLSHNSLRSLWTFMVQEFARTTPAGCGSISNVLKAEYRNAADGEIMGAKTFLYDAKTIKDYLDDEMRWWKGDRGPQGVCVEEAYKCGFCEFADECAWRKNKILEATEKMRRTGSSV